MRASSVDREDLVKVLRFARGRTAVAACQQRFGNGGVRGN